MHRTPPNACFFSYNTKKQIRFLSGLEALFQATFCHLFTKLAKGVFLMKTRKTYLFFLILLSLVLAFCFSSCDYIIDTTIPSFVETVTEKPISTLEETTAPPIKTTTYSW